jgi:excisionase family DNA binding protein
VILFCCHAAIFIALQVKNSTMGKHSELTLFDLAVRIKQLEDRLDRLANQPPPLPKPPKYVDVATASQILGLSRSSLYNLMQAGKLSFVQVGRQRRVLAADIEKYLEGDYIPSKPSIL